MDLKELTSISDSKKNVSVSGMRVVKHENPLDNIPLRERVSDSEEPKVKVVYKIMDDSKIKAIMTAPTKSRREFLSKLSDSDRSKLLARYAKIKDGAEDTGNAPEDLDFMILEVLLVNAIFTQDEYDVNILTEFCKDKELPQEIKSLIDAVTAKDSAKMKESVGAAAKSLQEKGVDTNVENVVNTIFSGEQVEDSSEITDVVKQRIISAGRQAAKTTKGFPKYNDLTGAVDNALKSYFEMNIDPEKVVDLFKKGWDEGMNEVRMEHVKDSIIEEIEKTPVSHEDGSQKSLLEELNDAILEYANGNDKPLKKLSEIDIKGNKIDGSEEGQSEESEEHNEEGHTEGQSEESEEATAVKDCATQILNNEPYCGSLAGSLPALQGFVYYQDPCEICGVEYPNETDYTECPMQVEEFNNLYQTPGYVMELAKGYGSQCPVVNTVEENKGFVTINKEDLPQNWMPIMGSCCDAQNKLDDSNKAEWREIINKNYVLVSDFCKAAARTNNLAAIDNRFYKAKFSDSCWVFNELPMCLKDSQVTPGCKLYPKWAKVEAEKEVTIFGSTFKY